MCRRGWKFSTATKPASTWSAIRDAARESRSRFRPRRPGHPDGAGGQTGLNADLRFLLGSVLYPQVEFLIQSQTGLSARPLLLRQILAKRFVFLSRSLVHGSLLALLVVHGYLFVCTEEPLCFKWRKAGNQQADEPEEGNVCPRVGQPDEKGEERRMREDGLHDRHGESLFLVGGEYQKAEEQMVGNQDGRVSRGWAIQKIVSKGIADCTGHNIGEKRHRFFLLPGSPFTSSRLKFRDSQPEVISSIFRLCAAMTWNSVIRAGNLQPI